MFKNILVGVDGSEHSLKALATGVNLAREYDANLHVFHAIAHHYSVSPNYTFPAFPVNIPWNFQSWITREPITAPTNWQQEMYEESGKQILEQAKGFVQDMCPEHMPNATYHLEANLTPEDFVDSFVKENGIDLVVVGCYGHHSGIKQLTGTVATRIMNAAPCHVLLVR